MSMWLNTRILPKINPRYAYYISQVIHDGLFLFPEIEGGFYTVKFDSLLLKEAVLEADCVIPPLRQDENSSSDSEDDLELCDEGYAKGLMFQQHRVFPIKSMEKCLNFSDCV